MQCSKETVTAEGLNFWSTGDLNHNKPVVDIIAVQGLGSHPYYTWVKKIKPEKSGVLQKHRNTHEVMWLRDFLPNLVPNARIASYSYRSDWRENVKTSLRECAEQFLNILYQNRLRDQERERPLIIIAHSLGGLVVKQALVIAVHREDFREIRLATCGVIFLGTPHQGCSAAQYAKWHARATRKDTTLLETLEKNSPILDGLARDFESSYGEADIVCFYEAKDGLGGIRLVDRISASLPSKRRLYLRTDHSGLNKYHSANDGNFLLVQSELSRMVKAAPETLERQYNSYGSTIGNNFFRVNFDLKGIPVIDEFVGREDEIEKIAQIMLPHSTEQTKRKKICLLYGIGGVGKTQLAVEFARKYREDFSAVFWIAGSTKVKLRLSIDSLVEKLPQHQISERARSGVRSNEQDFDAIVPDVLNWFKKPSNNKWLLIFDNVDRDLPNDPEGFDIVKYIPSADHGSILITSQSRDMEFGRPTKVKLEPFDDRQGKDLLESIVGRDLEGSSKLVNLLQGHPMAINQAGSYMRETGTNAITYMRLYEDSWEELMELMKATDRSILTTWTLSFNNLKEKSDDAANFLLLWALLDNQEIWYELFKAALDHKITKQLPDWFSRCVDRELQFSERVRLLTRYSFVSANLESSSFSMHAIIQRWCLYNLREKMAMTWLAIVITASAVPAETGIDYTKQQKRLLPHCSRTHRLLQHIPETIDDASSRAESSLALNTACHSLAKVLIDQGKIPEAEAMYKRARSGRKQFPGADDKSTLETTNNLGNLYLHQGELEKAKEMYDEALKGKESAYGPEDVSTMDTANNLGTLCKAQGNYSEAEKMYLRALAGYEKALGPGHISTMDTLHNLGILYIIQGKVQDAKKMYKRAYAGKKDFLGLNHTSTLETLNDLGTLYKNQGKMTKAEKKYEEALAGKEESWGREHTSTLSTVKALGVLHLDQGKILEAEGKMLEAEGKMLKAEVEFDRALDGFEKALGPEHIFTLEALNNLGSLYLKQGKLPEAKKKYLQALNGYEKALGLDHISTRETANNLGSLYFEQGKLPKAEKMFAQALTGNEKALGSEHPSTLAIVYNLGNLYSIQGKMPEAEEKYLWALTGFEKNLGAEHPSTLATAGILGSTYRFQGKIPEAKVKYLQALKGYENTLGPKHISTIQIVNHLGFVYHSQGNLPEAAAMFERALAGFEKAPGPEHTTNTLETAFILGIMYQAQGNLPKAVAMCKRAFAGYEKTENRLRTLNIRFMLAGYLEEMRKIQIATEHYKEVVQGYTELLGPDDPVTVKALHRLKSCEALEEKSGDDVDTGDADENSGNGGGGVGGCNVTGDADGNGGNNSGGIGGSDVTGDADGDDGNGNGGGVGVAMSQTMLM